MSKFFVGQRVRIVGTEYLGWGTPPAGKEGRISKRGAIGATTGRSFEWEVMADDFGPVQLDSHEIEPILPEGAAPSVYTFQQLMDELQEAVA